MALVAGFAFAELMMVLAAGGGVVYLLTSEKQKNWLIMNIGLFFIAGFTGLLMFMLL